MIKMSKFRSSVEKVSGGSHVLKDRTKMPVDVVMEEYPDGVTVDEFDLIRGRTGDPYGVFHIAGTDYYFNGGTIATQIAQDWSDFNDGDTVKGSAELKAEGGIKLKFGKKKTRNGNTVTTVELAD